MARLIAQVIGHEESWQTLVRQHERRHLPHALGFVGPSGIGKKRVAWAFAQVLVCETGTGCGECPACRRVENQQSESVILIEPQNGVIKLESAHEILQFLTLQRLGRARVVIVDSAQTMNPQATNALLKAIEEPPEETYFLLLIDELSQMLSTLRSRLQILRFHPLSEAQVRSGKEIPEWMVRSARGSFERLEKLNDPEFEELRRLTMDFVHGALAGQREALNSLFDHIKDRESALNAIRFLQQMLRDWSVLNASEVIHSDLKPRLMSLRQVSEARRLDLWRRAFQMEQDFNAHVDKTLLFENFYHQAKAAT